ncbi:MAG: carboxy terminal-processing peptidase, partial [Verrucomicrobiota bacterium]|nr:carboxy terminal-processing peptidase [Verrucomicrobiota bacterium]
TQVKGVPSDIALPSVNEFLPIGEDDLPHALPWDEVEAVDWINDWVKLKVDSPERPELIAALADASQARQESLEEFQFLRKQIKWRKKRYDEKAISISLENRIQRKINEKTYIDELDDIYEALGENDYVMEEFLLKITEDQDALSKEILSEQIKEIADSTTGKISTNTLNKEIEETSEEEEEAVYDIYLRESARIMTDWVRALEKPKAANYL